MTKEKIVKFSELLSEYFLYAFVFFTPIGHGGASVCFGLMALCFVVRKMIRPDFTFLFKREHLWLLIFFIFCALSIVNSGLYFQKSLRALITKWGQYAAVFFLVQDALWNQVHLERFMKVVLIVAGIVGIDALAQLLLGADLFFGRAMTISSGFPAVTATFKHCNNFAAYLTIVTSLSIAFLISVKTKKIFQILLLLSALLITCLFLTFSRGAWLGFFCGTVLMMMLSKRYKILTAILLAFVAIMFLYPGIGHRVVSAVQPGAGNSRFVIWQVAFQMIQENPFLGKGIGTFMDYHGNWGIPGTATYAHNCYLQIWAETGIFSLLTFLLFVGTILWKGLKAFSKNHNVSLLGLLCGIFAFLVHSFFDTQFYSVSQAFLIWSMLGALIAASREAPPAISPES